MKMRLARESDIPLLREIHRRQTEGGGFSYEFPEDILSDPRYFLVRVYEERGEVQGAVISRMTTETYCIGDSPRLCKAITRDAPILRRDLGRCGIFDSFCFVPEKWAESMGKIMNRIGFYRDKGFVSFWGRI